MSAVLEMREPNARHLNALQPPLVRHFELVSGAGSVASLRRAILTLAMLGRLVPQESGDEPAELLIARVRIAKEKMQSAGSIGQDKPTLTAVSDEDPPPLPRGWSWCRLGDLAWPQAGFAFKSTAFNEVGTGLPLVRIRDVGSASEPTTFYAGEYRDEFVVDKGDWLISMDGEFRVRRWHAKRALLNQRVTRLIFVSPEVNQDFAAMVLQRELTLLQGTKAYTTVDHLSGKQIAEVVVGLPPKQEQARIVSRVDELMRLCDALEAKGRLEAEQHARLVATVLGALSDSATAEELVANWQRVAAHFDLLLDRPEAVDMLEQTMKQLAVRGLLVPQDAQESPAEGLLQQIATEKDELVTKGLAKHRKPVPPVTEAEKRFAVPATWTWARLEQLSVAIVDCPHSTPKFVESGVLCIDTVSFKNGSLLPHKLRYVETSTYEQRIDRLEPLPGDLVFAREGSVGESIIIPPGTKACLGQRVMLFRFSQFVSNEFVRLSVSTVEFLDALLDLHKGIGAKHVNVGDMRNAVVPLPPLAEQRRILKRVNELRRLCADLRQRLADSQGVQARLADALVEQVTA